MKNKLIKVLLLAVITSLTSYGHALTRKYPANATITVKVNNPELLKYPYRFSVIDDYIYQNLGAVTTTVEANKKGEYVFRLNALSDKMIILIECGESEVSISNFVEPGDQVKILYSKSAKPGNRSKYTLSFSGKGCEKFIAQQVLRSTEPTNKVTQNNWTELNKHMIDTLLINADSTYAFKMRTLSQFKEKMNPHIYNKMQADLFGETYSNVYSYLKTTFRDSRQKDILATFYNKYQNKLVLNLEDEWNSYNYLQFLLVKSKAKYQLRGAEHRKAFGDICDIIINDYVGLTREKLLLNYLLNPLNSLGSDSPDSVYIDALRYLKTPQYSTYISNQAKAVKKGMPAYNFMLSDEKGKIRTLSEFRGKLVLLDCWFTGCTNCAVLAKIIDQEILPVYKGNKHIVFISVNVDLRREHWLEGIKTGQYTNANSINLYTDGKGPAHPFIKEYNFQGFPQLILIDHEGKIFSTTMQKNGKDICATIARALESMTDSK